MTEDNQRKPEFNEIKDWLQEHLGKPNNLILGNNAERREVIINSVNGPVAYKIPAKTPQNVQAFKNAWVGVYLECLKYLNKQVSNLFLKESLTLEDENTVLVGNQKFTFSNDMDSIAYINTLERITIAYDELVKSRKVENPINFKTRSVEITNPATIQPKVVKIPVPAQEVESKEIAAVRPVVSKVKPTPKNNFENCFMSQKLSDDEVLTNIDCKQLDSEKIIFITCTNLSKGENTFRDNADLLIENLSKIPRAAFITGRVIRIDQIHKEVTKIMKLCRDYINSGVIMYEINNEAIQSMGEDREALNEAISAISKLLDVLASEHYKPMVCLDIETKQAIENINFKYPTFIRVLPRELSNVDPNANLVVMDPQYDNDQVIVKNPNIVEYLGLNYNYEDEYEVEEALVKAL